MEIGMTHNIFNFNYKMANGSNDSTYKHIQNRENDPFLRNLCIKCNHLNQLKNHNNELKPHI